MVLGFIFLIGLSIGSFLNVLIDRLPKEEDVLTGRSYCDHCHHQLAWHDLIPLLSFIFLRGRCCYCRKKLSFYYPVIELITGLSFIFIYQWVKGWCSTSLDCYIVTLLHCYIVASLIVIFFADLKYQIIPDKITYPAIVIAGIFNFQFSRLPSLGSEATGGQAIFNYFLAGLGAFGFLGALFLLTRGKGMGFGDVKLAFLMGLILGFPKIIIALYLAFLTGALVSVILILIKKKKFGQTIAFGPFLVLGTIIAMFWGEEIINWWLRVII